MIGIDWGTTSLRAYRLDRSGAIAERREQARGILGVPQGGFPDALRAVVGDWLADKERHVVLAGMVGSRQGWQEAPYLPCPAGIPDLATAVQRVPFSDADIRLVPGVSGKDPAGVPDVMRGEETQIAGVLAVAGADGLVCLPGTHCKWATLEAGRIVHFTTHMTGEAFAALRGHTILGRMMQDGPHHEAAFVRGVARAGDPGGLLHHLFGVRALGLFGALPENEAASYLSGLLIGHEVRAALPPGGVVHLVGSAMLTDLYAQAIAACGGTVRRHDADAAARGLALIGETIEWN